MGILITLWVICGLVGAIIYLARTGYLWSFFRDQFLYPIRQSGGGIGEFFFSLLLVPVFIVANNFAFFFLALVSGPIAVFWTLRMDPAAMLQAVEVNLESHSRLEARDVRYYHYPVGEYEFKCSQCGASEPLVNCPACNCDTYGPASSGIACRKCDRGICNWKCPACGHVNSVKATFMAVRPKLIAGA